jgi:hypothetical protein
MDTRDKRLLLGSVDPDNYFKSCAKALIAHYRKKTKKHKKKPLDGKKPLNGK